MIMSNRRGKRQSEKYNKKYMPVKTNAAQFHVKRQCKLSDFQIYPILRMALSSYGSVDGDFSDLESTRVDNNPADTPDRHSLV